MNRARTISRLVVLGASLALAASLGGCVRLDTPPPQHPVLTSAQQLRQDTAAQAVVLTTSARRVADTAEPHVADLLRRIAEQTQQQADQLGGVYVAFPDGPPVGVATPDAPASDNPAVIDTGGVLALLVQDWHHLRDAVTATGPGPATPGEADSPEAQPSAQVPSGEPDPQEGTAPADPDQPAQSALSAPEAALYASVAVSRAGQITALAAALGVPAPELTDPATDPLAVGDHLLGPTAYPGTSDGQALRTLDAARFALETAAARLDGGPRGVADEAARRSAAAVEGMLSRGVQDVRRAAYASGDPRQFADDLDMARRALLPVQQLHLQALSAAEPADRAALLDGAARAQVSLVYLGVTPGHELNSALPGVEEVQVTAETP